MATCPPMNIQLGAPPEMLGMIMLYNDSSENADDGSHNNDKLEIIAEIFIVITVLMSS